MCTRPASTASANSTMWRVPSTLATRWRLGVGGHVVDRRQVEEVVDLALEAREVLVGDAEPRLGEVADDADDALLVDAPAVAQLLEPALRALADEHVDRPLALEQQLDQVAADEAGRAGDEVAHSSPRSAAEVALTLLLARWAFELAPDPGDRGEPDVKLGRTGGSAVGEDRAWSATGSRSSPAARSSARSARCRSRRRRASRRGRCSRCGFCDHAARARSSSCAEDVFDTAANEVVLVARVA